MSAAASSAPDTELTIPVHLAEDLADSSPAVRDSRTAIREVRIPALAKLPAGPEFKCPPAFFLEASDENRVRRLFRNGPYALAAGFIRGDFGVAGDLVDAVRRLRVVSGSGLTSGLLSFAGRFQTWRLERVLQSHRRAAGNVRFHYDRSNDFYRQFLDKRLVYSCAYFRDRSLSLDEAQLAKLEHICRKLDLRPGERFLDVGCGWGSLVFHAAARHGVRASGCTLSKQQYEHASLERRARGIEKAVRLYHSDYRKIGGTFDKIASIGMFEHVGRRRLRGYFERMASLLADGGLFLNHGIVRPQRVEDDVESLILRRYVFPGGELVHLSDVIREAENAGFEVLVVENLRPHYALTCRAWVERLQRNEEACLRTADGPTYRTWLLFLAASADCFEQGQTDVQQVLLAKRSNPSGRRLSREHMYS